MIPVSGSKYWEEREAGEVAQGPEGAAGLWGDAWHLSLLEGSSEGFM